MFGVDGQDGHLVAGSGGGHYLASHHHSLLVGQGDGFVVLDGTEGGTQTGKAHYGGQNHIDGAHFHEVGNGVVAGKDFDAVGVESGLHLGVFGLVGNGNGVGLELECLLYQQVGVAAGAQHLDGKAVAVTPYHVQRLCAYGAC